MRPDLGGPSRGWPPGFLAAGADRDALLVLSACRALTPRRLHELAWAEGTARGCLRAVCAGAASAADRAIAEATRPLEVRRALRDAGAETILAGDADYPEILLDLPDPPAWLFRRGRPLPETLGEVGSVAVVGARRCTAYGREAGAMLGAGLAARGVAVVSGAALGVDAAAHRGALRSRGRTVAVLGSGIDVPHPKRHAGLLAEIAREGTVVGEYPPGTPAEPWRFPARNRLIAGLSRAVVVVEGAPGSGSLITVEFALDLGREVLAVPGPIGDALSEAPHRLIRDGATLVRGPEDVLEALGVHPGAALTAPESRGHGTEPGPTRAGDADALSETERQVLDSLGSSPSSVDALVASTGLAPSVLITALMALELRGVVRAEGGRYSRTLASASADRVAGSRPAPSEPGPGG